MAVLLPFRAFRSLEPVIYVPGEEPPPAAGTFEYVKDAEPALFVYRQRFRFPGDSEESFRDGIMGLLNRREATVFPHEETSPERVAACARALQFRGNDPGSLWLWCEDSSATLAPLLADAARSRADIEITDRFGCLHQMWRLTDSRHIDEVQAALEGKSLFLADGHHRYAAGWDLATIQLRGPALRNLASHRLVLDARELILPDTQPVEDPDIYLNSAAPGFARSVLVTRGPVFRGFEISRPLNIERLAGGTTVPIRGSREAILAVEAGEARAAFLLAPFTLEQIEADAKRGILLPAKSTDFHPKLAAGLVVHRHQNESVMPPTAQRPGVLNPSS